MSLIPLAAMLAACGDEPAEPEPDKEGQGAAGEVLGGSISDNMIPLDQLRSQSPPLESEPDTQSPDEQDDEVAGEG